MQLPSRGETIELQAHDVNQDGHGVARHPSGLIFFIADLWPDEKALCKVVAIHKSYGVAQIDQRLTASEVRVAPFCAHHGTHDTACTACPWQGIDYPAQLSRKEARLETSLSFLGSPISSIWPSPQISAYRNRAQFKTDGQEIGYVNGLTLQLAPIDACPILSKRNQKTLKVLKGQLPNRAWQSDDGFTSLDIDEGISAAEVSINARRPFRQGNQGQNKQMRAWLAEQINALPPRQIALELFCGSGNFTEVLVKEDVKPIVAADVGGEAIGALRAHKWPLVTAHICNLGEDDGLKRFLRQQTIKPSLLVLDPPRTGFAQINLVLEHFKSLQTILYISCDLSSFARDAKTLVDAGFVADELQPIDMFPHTPHIEVLSVFRRTAALPV